MPLKRVPGRAVGEWSKPAQNKGSVAKLSKRNAVSAIAILKRSRLRIKIARGLALKGVVASNALVIQTRKVRTVKAPMPKGMAAVGNALT